MDGWKGVRMTNRTLCCSASEISSITQMHGRPAYTLSFLMNYTEQTNRNKFVLHVCYERRCRRKSPCISELRHQFTLSVLLQMFLFCCSINNKISASLM